MLICTKMTGLEVKDGFYRVMTNNAEIRIFFVTEEIIRLRTSFDQKFDEASYVLMTTAWPDRLDSMFQGERCRRDPLMPSVESTACGVRFRTSALCLELDRDPFCIRLYDAEGTELYHSLEGCAFTLDANRRLTHYSAMEEDDCFYGFGEQTGTLNKNKAHLRERAADAMGYDPVRTETLYKHVPFYIRLSRKTRKAVGLFYHNFYESEFNMGREKSNYRPRYSYWRTDGGDADLFLLGGGTLKRILDNYTQLTGRPVLLPKRAMGYQASSMYYPELKKDCDRAILDFAETLREEGFPLDGFHLSSGYTGQENGRCVFTWNRERFPDPGAYFAAMNRIGAQNVPNVKPGVLLSHPQYEELCEAGVFVRDSEHPEEAALDNWWGGQGAFWDFTRPEARTRWKRLLTEQVIAFGTDSVWNDNCEYDSMLDQDAIVDYDGAGGTIAALKPLMSTLMCRVGAEAVTEHDANRRPYIVCRSGSAGIQKYAQTWCGDNLTGWDTLRWNIPTILGMGLSGQPNEGADIGGFAGPAPSEELFLRWVQNGVFQPRFSIHSANSDNTVTEPWMYPDIADLIREAMLLRYRLLPYLYSAEYEASQTGAPIMRPLVYEFQEDTGCYDESFSFLFGRDLLVACVLEPGARERQLRLPAGCAWYDWNDGYRRYDGGRCISVPVTRESIPMFVREGGVIPMAEDQPVSMEGDHVRRLRLILAPGAGESAFTLYDDDGATNDYKRGLFRKTEIRMSGTQTVQVAFSASGDYEDFVEHVTVEMIHPESGPVEVTLGGEQLPCILNPERFEAAKYGWHYSLGRGAVLIRYPNPRRDICLTVSFEKMDLIKM